MPKMAGEDRGRAKRGALTGCGSALIIVAVVSAIAVILGLWLRAWVTSPEFARQRAEARALDERERHADERARQLTEAFEREELQAQKRRGGELEGKLRAWLRRRDPEGLLLNADDSYVSGTVAHVYVTSAWYELPRSARTDLVLGVTEFFGIVTPRPPQPIWSLHDPLGRDLGGYSVWRGAHLAD